MFYINIAVANSFHSLKLRNTISDIISSCVLKKNKNKENFTYECEIYELK